MNTALSVTTTVHNTHNKYWRFVQKKAQRKLYASETTGKRNVMHMQTQKTKLKLKR